MILRVMEHAARCGVETLTHPPPSSPPSERNCTSLPGVTVHCVREVRVSLKLSEKTVSVEFSDAVSEGTEKPMAVAKTATKSRLILSGIDL